MRALSGALSLLLAGMVCALSAGCAGPIVTSRKIVASPLNVEQQQQEVLKVVPLQTPRVEVERKLKAAGIELSPGTRPSIAYCDTWNRKDGSRWRLDVALLFDANDQLYATKQASAETRIGGTDPLGEGSPQTVSRNARGAGEVNPGGRDSRDETSSRGVVGSPFTRSNR